MIILTITDSISSTISLFATQITRSFILSNLQSRQYNVDLQFMSPNEREGGGVKQWKGADIDHRQKGDTGTRVSRSGRGILPSVIETLFTQFY